MPVLLDIAGTIQAVAQINKLNNVILNLFQNLWILRGYETLKQVQVSYDSYRGDNTWFEQQPVYISRKNPDVLQVTISALYVINSGKACMLTDMNITSNLRF